MSSCEVQWSFLIVPLLPCTFWSPHICSRSCHQIVVGGRRFCPLHYPPTQQQLCGFLGRTDQFSIEYNGNYVNLTAQNISNANSTAFSHSQKCPFYITSFDYPSIINVPEVCSWMSLYCIRILIYSSKRQRKKQFLEINIYEIRKTLNEILLLGKRKAGLFWLQEHSILNPSCWYFSQRFSVQASPHKHAALHIIVQWLFLNWFFFFFHFLWTSLK